MFFDRLARTPKKAFKNLTYYWVLTFKYYPWPMRKLLAGLVAAFICLAGTPAIAADPSVAGIVRNGTGTALAGVVVNANQNGTAVATTTTAADKEHCLDQSAYSSSDP